MTGPVVVEAAGADASDILERLNKEAFAGLAGRHWSARDFEEILNDPNAIGLIARIAGEVAGYALLRCAADEAELLTIGVAEARRGRGIGRDLVAEAARRAGLKGARRVLLEVAETNHAAVRFYAAQGFREDGRRPGYYRAEREGANARPVAAILLSLALPPLAR
jgi:ribosomal-protein-alanine acetyltransferase